MTNTTTELEVLKTDERGRVRMPVEKREKLLDEFERSGLSGVKFAALVGVKYPTFAYWVQRRRRLRVGGGQGGGSGSQRIGSAKAASAGRCMDRSGAGSAGPSGGGFGSGFGKTMLSFSGSLKVFVAVEPCDMRKGFNGRYAVVTERLIESSFAGFTEAAKFF